MSIPSQIHHIGDVIDTETFQFKRRAIKSPLEAYNVCKRLAQYNRDRNFKNAAILKRFNDAQPFDQSDKVAAGAGWQSNRSTGFLSSLVKRSAVPYNQIIDQSETLTSSALRGVDPKSADKSKAFQQEITTTIKRWSGFLNFKSRLITENVLFGYTFGGYMDCVEWRPTFFESDSCLFEDGCGQTCEEIPMFCFKKNYLPIKLTDKFDDPKASEEMGWNLENLAKAINAACPETITGPDDWRKREDAARETTVGQTYIGGVSVVETFTLFVAEYTGKVSSYFMNARNGDPFLVELDKFENLEECLTPFTIETGNGKLHGSKGAGRIIYNTALMAENARNAISDNLFLAGMLILVQDEKNLPKPTIAVRHPFCVIPKGFSPSTEKFQVNTDAFFALDRALVSQAEMQLGSFMPQQIVDDNNNKETAARVNYTASIESQIRDALLSRFWGQFCGLVYNMQKRICTKEVIEEAYAMFCAESSGISFISKKMVDFFGALKDLLGGKTIQTEQIKNDKEAVYCVLNMLRKGLSRKEIFELANTPPQETLKENAVMKAQAIQSVSAQYAGNPMVDQYKLAFANLAAQVGYEQAKDLMPEGFDQNQKSDQVAKQLMELTSIMAGEDMPISQMDDDVTHLETVRQKEDKLIATLTQGQAAGVDLQAMLPILKLVLAHTDRHLQAAHAKGIDPSILKPYEAVQQVGSQLLQQVPPPPTSIPAPGSNQTPMDAGQSSNGVMLPNADPAQSTLSEMSPAEAAGSKPLSKGPVNLTPQL